MWTEVLDGGLGFCLVSNRLSGDSCAVLGVVRWVADGGGGEVGAVGKDLVPEEEETVPRIWVLG
jgi:hypothetical protein